MRTKSSSTHLAEPRGFLMRLQFAHALASIVAATGIAASLLAGSVNAQTTTYYAILSGAAEAPPNTSTGIGTARVTFNTTSQTMHVVATFSGLTGNVTASHIHCCNATPFVGTSGVATVTPTFTGFPSGVTSGSYDQTFDMTLAAGSFNAAFVTANGGTPATAFAALQAGTAAGKAYFNIHTSTFGGGEIRGFPVQATLDVDASASSTRYHALTDGLLIMRYLLNSASTPATAGATGVTATRTLPADVKAYLDTIKPALDIDGDTNFDASTDGMLIVRYLLGLRGDSLIANAVTPGAPRNSAALIEAYLATLTP